MGVNFYSEGGEYFGVLYLGNGWWICYRDGDPDHHLQLRKEDGH